MSNAADGHAIRSERALSAPAWGAGRMDEKLEGVYETVLRPAWQRLADRFATMMKEGRLKFADPWTTAMHWKGLNEWDMLERHLLSANSAADPNDIVTAATAAADAFLKVYAAPYQPGEVAL